MIKRRPNICHHLIYEVCKSYEYVIRIRHFVAPLAVLVSKEFQFAINLKGNQILLTTNAGIIISIGPIRDNELHLSASIISGLFQRWATMDKLSTFCASSFW